MAMLLKGTHIVVNGRTGGGASKVGSPEDCAKWCEEKNLRAKAAGIEACYSVREATEEERTIR